MPGRPLLVSALAVGAVLALGGAADVAPAAPDEPEVAASVDRRPNVVLVVADDLGWGDLGSGRAGDGTPHGLHQTPAIDRLAREGMVFDRAYAAINCAPSRAALLSGLSAPRPGNNVYAVSDLNRGAGPDALLRGVPQGRGDGAPVLPPETVTVAETLQGAGYRTGYVGKFHVTRGPGAIEQFHGFDVSYGGSGSGHAKTYHAAGERFDDSVAPTLDPYAGRYTEEYVRRNVAPHSTGVDPASLDALVGTEKHVTDALADAALDTVDDAGEQPFLTVVGEYAVHSPISDEQARSDLREKYRALDAGAGAVTGTRPAYAALLEGLDQSVARIVEHLEQTPDPRSPGHALAENTLVVVTSDNGGRVDLGASNGPLRGQKGELLEGGVRVPWIVWSGSERLVRGGTVNSSVIDGTDLHPTLADYAGADLPAGAPIDGDSLREAYARGRRLHRPRFAHVPGYLVDGGRAQRPESWVREGRWKLTYGYEQQTWRLYDVDADPGESSDLAGVRPDVVQRLGRRLLGWLDDTDAPLATLRQGREPVRLRVDGETYADGRRTSHRRPTTLVVEPGGEMPAVLPRNGVAAR